MSVIDRLLAPLRALAANDQRRRYLALVIATLGVLALVFGIYTFLEAHSKYTELSAVVERLGPPTDPNDASNHAFALLLRDRDRAGTRRFEGVMFMGLALATLGVAYLVAPTHRPAVPSDSPDSATPLPGTPPDHP